MKLTYLFFIMLNYISIINGNYLKRQENHNNLNKTNNFESLKLVIRDLVKS